MSDDVRLATEPVVDFVTGFLNAVMSALTFIGILLVVGGSITISLAPWRSRRFSRLAKTGWPSVGLAPITSTTSASITLSKSCVPALVPKVLDRP